MLHAISYLLHAISYLLHLRCLLLRTQSLLVRAYCFVSCGGWLVFGSVCFFARAIVSGELELPLPSLYVYATPRAVIAADGGAATVRGWACCPAHPT